MKIKTLEWEHVIDRVWTVDTVFGKYQITVGHIGTSMPHMVTPGILLATGYYTTVEEAQASAQADFESRVMSCMED